VVEVLAALVAMGFRPPAPWLQAALAQVQQRGFATCQPGPSGQVALEGGPAEAGAAVALLEGGEEDWQAAGGWDEGEGEDEGWEEEEEGAAGGAADQGEEAGLRERLASNSRASTSAGAGAAPQQQRRRPGQAPGSSTGSSQAPQAQQEEQEQEEQEEEEEEQDDQLGAVLLWDPASPAGAAELRQGLRRPLGLDELALLAWCLDQLVHVPPQDWVRR
jgi:hypothetical protein